MYVITTYQRYREKDGRTVDISIAIPRWNVDVCWQWWLFSV